MKRKTLLLACILGAAQPMTAMATGFAKVTNGNDSGYGSLRAALASGAQFIFISPFVNNIDIKSSLVYTGDKKLKLFGTHQVISGNTGDQPLLEISNGADLTIKNLEFAGPGGYSIENQGGGKGIFLKVPVDQTEDVNVVLKNVTVRDTGYHGVHVSDCTTGDDCGAGQGGLGDGSPVSIYMTLDNVLIDNVGTGRQDGDGVRIDDRDEGDVYFDVYNSIFTNVGGDGIELDEGGNGTVSVNAWDVAFLDNGAYCSADFVADPIALDPNCNDDGDPDVDDAFDIDEAGNGGIEGTLKKIELINNYDEGLDFDSEGTGDNNYIDLKIVNVFARDNDDEAIKISEEEDASVLVKIRRADIGGDIEVEEEDGGDLKVVVKKSSIGDDLKLAEDGDGVGVVKLRNTTIADEKDFVNVDEI